MPTLTLSGNEVTDAIRAAQGEGVGGFVDDSSVEIWEATSNVFADGSFEAGLDSWASSETLVQSSDQAHAGTKSAKMTAASGSSYQRMDRVLGTLGPGVYAFSVWLYSPSSLTKVRMSIGNATDGATRTVETSVGAGWTRLFVVHEMTVSEELTAQIHLSWNENLSSGEILYIDDAMFEPRHEPTPFNASGTGACRVTAPSSLLAADQGWVAMRVRFGWEAGNAPAGPVVFDWGKDGSDRILLFYNAATDKMTFRYITGGVVEAVTSDPAEAHSIDGQLTIIIYWTADELGISTAGANFITVARTLANFDQTGVTIFDICRNTLAAAGWLNVDVLWFACGTGVLTDAEAAAFHALGATDPDEGGDFVETQVPTMLWQAVTADYITEFDFSSPDGKKKAAILLGS